jgi:hypothetical protein
MDPTGGVQLYVDARLKARHLIAESRGLYQSPLRGSARPNETIEAREAMDHLLSLPWLSQKRASKPPPLADDTWSDLDEQELDHELCLS